MRNIILASLLVIATPAAAATNIGFETGDTSGWTTSGSAGAATSYGVFTPVAGSFLGFVLAGDQDIYSKLSQVFTLGAGQSIKGRVGFQADDYLPFDDDAYLSVNGTNIFTSSISAVGDFGNSGWVNFNFIAPIAGSYTLELGVANRGDSGFNSFAVLDASAVPEAGTWAMMIVGFGLVGLASRGRARRRNNVSA